MSELTPISFEFVEARIARQSRIALARLKPSQVNKEQPSWNGQNGKPDTAELKLPITDKGDWENRYVFTEITLYKENNEKLLINDAVISISSEKNIVRTSLVGLNGTIKEYICDGDYEINLSVGIVAVDNETGLIVDEYPQEGIKKIKSFLSENKSIRVSSPFLSIFDIDRIAITEFSLNQETDSNRQTIAVRALSDKNYEINNTAY